MGDLVVGAEGSDLPTSKVCPVAGYDSVWETKMTYEVLPQEFDYLLPRDFG